MYQFGAPPEKLRAAGVIKLLDEIGRKENGVTFLGLPWWANAHVWLKDPVNSIDELKGKKIRSHPSYDPLIKGLGIPTVTVSFSEIFTALDRGLLDGTVFPYFDLVTYGLHRALKYRLDPPFWRASWVIFLANAKKFDSLPPDVQKLLVDSIIEIEKKAPEMYDAMAAEEAEKLKAAGIQALKLSKGDWLMSQQAGWEKGLPDILLKVSPKYGKEVIEMMGQFYPPKKEYKAIGLD
jgi:TRAP-type C4-dicarboxylate transport system substrate-binding protein